MARGNTSCSKILAVFLCGMLFALGKEGGAGMVAAESRLWPVGDHDGWTFGVLGWPNYKPFAAGDVLLFKYQRGAHNVVEVSSVQYALCQVPGNATVWSSGEDRITLARGMTFFVCGIPGHCEKGMKIAVTAR